VLGIALACGAGILPRHHALAQGSAEHARLPELVRTEQRTFSIPLRLPATTDADAAPQRVVMSVSKDLGSTWESLGEVTPATGNLTYQAGGGGEYWFRLRVIDSKGRVSGGQGPDARVLVDATGPRLAARVWKGADGEVVCRYAAMDDSIRMESFKLEYRTANAQGWTTIAAKGVLSAGTPAYLVGEEIWWAGARVDALTVRITVADSAGNTTMRQFTMEPAATGVEQAALAQKIGASAVPTQPTHETADSRPITRASSGTGDAGPAGGWTPETAALRSAEQPAVPAGRGGPQQSVLVSRTDWPSETATDFTRGPSLLASTAARLPLLLPATPAGYVRPLEYRGRPLHLSRTRRFAWDYKLPAEIPDASRLHVELWSTRDGHSWQKAAVDNDAVSPINVALPAAGFYGFRLEVVPDGPDASTGPQTGDMPESWIGVDEDPPLVEFLGAARLAESESSGVVIRYSSRDQLPAPKTARLLFSPNPEGPWATIASAVDNQGEYRWQPDGATPAQVYLRIEVTDAAGNVGTVTSPDAVTVTNSRMTGSLGGVRTLPAGK
jgi:hypothetical protein